MICATNGGVSLFLYRSLEDGPCTADEWYETLAQAEGACRDRYGISSSAWQIIADPPEGCRHDWIAPVPLKE